MKQKGTQCFGFDPLQERPSRSGYADWRIYAAAAGATLAMSTNVQAGTITTGMVGITLHQGGSPGGTAHHSFSIAGSIFQAQLFNGSGIASAVITDLAGKARFFDPAGYNRALDFAQSFAIGSRAGVLGRRDAGLRFRNFSLNTSSGSFGPGDVKGFIGFEDGVGRYGWIQVEVSDTGTPGVPNELQVINWAYDNTPGETIAAGDTGASATPEPDSLALGLLALGAPGILSWRRRRAEAAGAEKPKAA